MLTWFDNTLIKTLIWYPSPANHWVTSHQIKILALGCKVTKQGYVKQAQIRFGVLAPQEINNL